MERTSQQITLSKKRRPENRNDNSMNVFSAWHFERLLTSCLYSVFRCRTTIGVWNGIKSMQSNASQSLEVKEMTKMSSRMQTGGVKNGENDNSDLMLSLHPWLSRWFWRWLSSRCCFSIHVWLVDCHHTMQIVFQMMNERATQCFIVVAKKKERKKKSEMEDNVKGNFHFSECPVYRYCWLNSFVSLMCIIIIISQQKSAALLRKVPAIIICVLLRCCSARIPPPLFFPFSWHPLLVCSRRATRE